MDASLAYKCLNSVPLGKQAAIDLVDAIVPYSEWQSDAAYKANPPPDYFFPPVDIYAQLSRIKAALQADQYANEYEFQADLFMNVTGAAHDGHFAVYTDLLTGVFGFHRQHALVSISEDGSSLPVIKVYGECLSCNAP